MEGTRLVSFLGREDEVWLVPMLISLPSKLAAYRLADNKLISLDWDMALVLES